ncbi:MAG: EscN/YscN/HrcN family type III secretion system ATPase, partial [Burkholderia sp.]
AIDVLGSLSRVMSLVVPDAHNRAASRIRELMAKHRDVEVLLQVGEYQPGQNPLADEAIEKADAIRAFLCQRTSDYAGYDETNAYLHELSGVSA